MTKPCGCQERQKFEEERKEHNTTILPPQPSFGGGHLNASKNKEVNATTDKPRINMV